MKHLFNSIMIKYLMQQKRRVLICVAIFVSQAALTAISPMPLSFAIDHVLNPNSEKPTKPYLQEILNNLGPMQSLLAVVGAIALVYFLGVVLSLLESYYLQIASNVLSESVKKEMFRRVIRTKKSYLDQTEIADVIGRLSQDSLNIQVLFQTGLPVLVRSIPSLLMILGVLFTVNTWLAVGMSCVAALMFYTTFHFTHLSRLRRREVRKAMTDYEQHSFQYFTNFMLVKLLHRQVKASKTMARIGRQVSNTLFCANWYETMMMASMDTIKATLRVLVVLIGGIAVLRGNFTVGGIMLVMQYINSIAASMSDLTKFSYKSARAIASLDRIEELLNNAGAAQDPNGTESMIRTSPVSLHFDKVSFGYLEATSTLNQLSLQLLGGQAVAVVGPSGIGKSTLLNLVSRIIRPTNGEIRINGQSVNSLRAEELHSYISYVPQRLFFLKESIRNNLLWSTTFGASEDTLWSALRKVNGESFVRCLDEQLDTVIGDSGKIISGGQSRRLALARGFLRDPDGIFMFDEPTDGLEPESRGVVLESLRKLSDEGALVLYTTHRQEELAIADVIIEFHGLSHITVRRTKPTSFREQPAEPSLHA